MGILDDAIREHLELKRSHGAGDSELKQLEDEAFGLPTRPGEPDFPDPAGEEAAPPEPAAQAPATAEVPPAAETEPPPVEPEQTAMEHPVVEPQTEPEIPAPAEAEVDRVEPVEEATASAETGTPAAEDPEPTAFYDRAEAEELDLGDLDLDLEEEIDEGLDELGGREPSDEGEPPAAEVVDVDTVEHAPPESPPEEGAEPEPAIEGEEASEEGEDVLEETPEFLQDRPEDDELWFEQGKPKDFDF